MPLGRPSGAAAPCSSSSTASWGRRFLRAAVLDAMLTPAVRTAQPDTAELISDMLRHAGRQGLAVTMRSVMLNRPDLTSLLPRITAPAVVVAGGDDAMWAAADAAAAARHLPHGQAGHDPRARGTCLP
jgi:pimeloyl-ACP methyl ester carboxylesterase